MMFIAIDGIDGAGKTTLINKLAHALVNFRPLITKEPTNESPWALEIRDSALRKRRTKEEELHLFHQDRMYHVETVIRPALKRGQLVLCDRYVDSTLAFQADSEEEAESLYRMFSVEIAIPDLTIILDCPVEIGLSRIKRNRARFTTYETTEILEKAKRIYDSRRGETYLHIDASGSADTTLKSTCKAMSKRFPHLSKALNDYMATLDSSGSSLSVRAAN